ncbi:MAG TPA: hypothetical protein PKL15_12840 [Saprospiraceae bacterium]|nr:hypothetical protein [Saprospiraceae bacterium]
MTKLSITCFAAFVLLSFSACQKAQPSHNDPEDSPCDFSPFSKHLKKTVTTRFYPGTSFSPDSRPTEYFCDDQGRVDSIMDDQTAMSVVYSADGRVGQLRTYAYAQPQVLNAITQYYYNNGQLEKTVAQYYDAAGNPATWSTTTFYEWDANGFIVKTWLENSNDKRVFTRDDCGNILKTQDFYNANNAEHFLAQSAFVATPNPYYQIGLDAIFPGNYSVHNLTFGQIVHWDCADYDPSPITSDYEYDTEGLPVKMTNTYRTEEYFYE